MSTEERVSGTAGSEQISLLRQGRHLISGIAHGMSSIAKSSVLRHDRVNDAFYASRVEVCQNCPGGHAQFNKNGSLATCGPMLKSLRGEADGTCGCILIKKARDVKESCPFGYWPTLEGDTLNGPDITKVAPHAVPGVAFNLLTRRHFMSQALGALAAGVIVKPAWAAEGDACYVKLTACGSGGQPDAYTDCSAVEGWELGKVYEGGDSECYTLSSSPPSGQAGTNYVTLLAGAKQDCQECEDDSGDPGDPNDPPPPTCDLSRPPCIGIGGQDTDGVYSYDGHIQQITSSSAFALYMGTVVSYRFSDQAIDWEAPFEVEGTCTSGNNVTWRWRGHGGWQYRQGFADGWVGVNDTGFTDTDIFC